MGTTQVKLVYPMQYKKKIQKDTISLGEFKLFD